MFSVSDSQKQDIIPLAYEFYKLGFQIYATAGTARALNSHGIPTSVACKSGKGESGILNQIGQGRMDIVINIPTKGRVPRRMGFQIRRKAVESGIPCMTSLDTAAAFLAGMKQEIKSGSKTDSIPVLSMEEIV